MFDFSVPEWDRGSIKGRNHKGLITYDRKTKKDAFYWYKANWSKEAVLYLPGRRNTTLDTNICTIKAYAAKNNHIYLDYFSSMVDERNGLKSEYSEDGVHPNAKGYKVMESLVEQAIAKALN